MEGKRERGREGGREGGWALVGSDAGTRAQGCIDTQENAIAFNTQSPTLLPHMRISAPRARTHTVASTHNLPHADTSYEEEETC
jgi:hypothetical protein